MSFFYQRASKLALTPVGGAVAAASTSILLGSGRTATNQKINHIATRKLNTITNRSFANNNFPSSRAVQNRKFASAVPKTAEAATTTSSSTATTAASSSTAKEGGKSGMGFVEWYEGHLQARPVATKAITGSILWGIGDVVAQVVPPYFAEKSADGINAAGEEDVVKKKEFKYDIPRTARAVIFGFALHAPLSHVHFNFLEWMTVKGGFSGLSIPVFKTIMEQFIYWSWISNSLYHGAMGAMQGMNFTQVYDRIADVLWDTQVAQWSFWIPVQLLNFQFVPVRHQLNVVLLTSVVWTALLSVWYPPEDNTDEKEIERKE